MRIIPPSLDLFRGPSRLTYSLVTERARRLRAQYHLQAQGLRSRVEIRVNRIPTSLRKMNMGDLLLKYLNQEQNAVKPPVPAKDLPHRNAANGRAQPAGRAPRRLRCVFSSF